MACCLAHRLVTAIDDFRHTKSEFLAMDETRFAEKGHFRPETSFRVKSHALTVAFKRQHDSDAFMAGIVAKRLIRYLQRAGYVVMKRLPVGGHSAIGRGVKGVASTFTLTSCCKLRTPFRSY
jgi:hypothetical protein